MKRALLVCVLALALPAAAAGPASASTWTDRQLPGEAAKMVPRFRFFARHHVKVRGFSCKIDGRPLKRCRSPKGYRVGFGKHVFRVRAIGWTGLKGPPAVARFRVCHPSPLPECLRRLPPPTA